VAAFVRRFVFNCRKREKRRGHLQPEEYQEAQALLWRHAQKSIRSQLDQAQCHSFVKLPVWLKRLEPTIIDGLVRVGGRLRKADNLPFAFRHPIILDGRHRVSMLIMRNVHERYGHAGLQFMKNQVVDKFCIIKLSWLAKFVRRRCVQCRKYACKPVLSRMADLPRERLQPTMPFVCCGVDYFGPFLVKRGRTNEKVWGVIFTCFSTRAVHLELAESLAADCFINVFRRFVGRRGEVSEMWSDNGTNFVGSQRELQVELRKLKSSEINQQLASRGIKWHFNPPAASHFGGAWERLIRSIRKALYAVMHGRSMTYAVLETALVEVEALMNSRPLAQVGTNAEDMSVLTPGHFLILRPFTAKEFAIIHDKEVNARSAWRKAQAMVNAFWKRWLREYVPGLRERPKWSKDNVNIKVGDLVLLIDTNSPRGKWPLGKVMKTYPGDDSVVRVVDVLIEGTILRRPVAKLSYVFSADDDIRYQ
jgi:hypothetical protein